MPPPPVATPLIVDTVGVGRTYLRSTRPINMENRNVVVETGQ